MIREAGPFRSLVLHPSWGGANRGLSRATGWAGFGARGEPLALAPGRPAPVASGALAAGPWDRVFAAVEAIEGVAPGGRLTRLGNHVEPIARRVEVPAGATVTVDVELVVLADRRAPGTYNVFVKDAWLARAGAVPSGEGLVRPGPAPYTPAVLARGAPGLALPDREAPFPAPDLHDPRQMARPGASP